MAPRDRIQEISSRFFGELPSLEVSAKTGEGLRKLRIRIVERIFNEPQIQRPVSEGKQVNARSDLVEVVERISSDSENRS